MEYLDWNPVYEAILRDFGFEKAADERVRDELATLLGAETTFDPVMLDLADDTVAIAGAGPSLEREAEIAREADMVFAAGTAADRLMIEGIDVDCVVTDLDKHPETVVRLTRSGTPVAVHAHGDNLELIRAHVPNCDSPFVLPTTQAEPAGSVRNFGGFTDGDRAAFLADHLDAGHLVFPGWSFDDDTVAPTKARKLTWAERLLYWLERRRDERFSILDGRRHDIDTTALPIS